ncbi:MAG: cell surface protein SprA [Paludibacteraceae bacterium]|nr:cell surface protein SprA [Paludibacteraceae bacterium]
MKQFYKYIIGISLLISGIVAFSAYAQKVATDYIVSPKEKEEKMKSDSTELRFPIKKEVVTYDDFKQKTPADLEDPSNVTKDVIYDPNSGYYIYRTRIGDMDIVTPFVLSEDEYRAHSLQESMNSYWAEKAKNNTDGGNKFSLSELKIGLGKTGDKIFGPGGIQLKTQGSVDLDFGFTISKRENPTISENNRINTIFDFDTKIQLSANGSVGDKINFNLNYNTEATFNADQSLVNLGYKGDEDDIIQRIEAGNVSLPLSSSLISGSTDLFGFRTDLQFGKLKVSAIITQQESERKTISTEGAQTTEFELLPTEYEENRHFFLSTYFYDHYDEWAKNAPNPQSGIVINKVEIWTTNNSNSTSNYTTRNVVALADLGETYNDEDVSEELPQNSNGTLYNTVKNNPGIRDIQTASYSLGLIKKENGDSLEAAKDFEILNNAKLLNASEYILNQELGYISLKSSVNPDNIVAVAYEYTKGGKTYRVGELTTSTTDTSKTSTQNIYVKLIKSSIPAPNHKRLWNLAMKNIYSLGAYNIPSDNFEVEIKYYYQSDSVTSYLTYIPALSNRNLLQVLNMDRLNKRNKAMPDGYFDYIEGYTVHPATGRIIFLSTRPFDKGIIDGYGNMHGVENYAFPQLYDSTLTVAEQYTEKNKFIITGEYSSTSGSEIRLGVTNIARGSVRVTAGGRTLTEGTGYTVDYNLGIVKILDETALASNSPIDVSVESQSFFNTQRKSLLGTNLEYAFSDKFTLGGTILHLSEKPLTQKVNLGNEPISNTIWGVNGTFKSDWQWLTSVIDKIPLINATAPSSVAFSGEFAQLLPGHNKAVNQDDYGTSYIDDFEGTESTINIKNPTAWALASTPRITNGPNAGKFIEVRDTFWDQEVKNGHLKNTDMLNIGYNLNRAHIAWYYIDQIFTNGNANTPKHIKNDKEMLSHHYIRPVIEQEIYQDKDPIFGESSTLQTLHLHYYPKERGAYNLDVDIDENGYLNAPEDNWAGIMRKLDNTNFETSNIEYLEFWLMDPFITCPDSMNTTPGKLVFNLGSVSEDVLKDGRKAFENGLPTSNNNAVNDTTIWGRVPRLTSITNSFDNSYLYQQDLGLDGISNDDEYNFHTYSKYYEKINSTASGDAKLRWAEEAFSPLSDPAGDNFHYFRGDDYDERELDIFSRYKYYNGVEGNSTANSDEFTSTATTSPDSEDLNGDNTLNETEQYYEYIVEIDKGMFENEANWESNFITNRVESTVELKNGNTDVVKWYQFRIPINKPNRKEGNINDFRSIRFIRMYLTEFTKEEHLRFGELQFVRTDWRVYEKNENLVDNSIADKLQKTGRIGISSVCIENDSRKKPVGYQLPPGIDRTIDPSQMQLTEENEQAMVLKIDSLEPNDARAVYKTITLDTRQYKRFKMFVHAEELIDGENIPDNRLYAFVRFGSDFTQNYYEYRIPLKITPAGAIDQYSVWPQANNFDFEFEMLTNLKLERDKKRNAGQVRYNERYTKMHGNNTMAVIGSPSFGDISSMMIGIVNEDDVTHSAEIWVNEMRMSGYDEEGGWAAIANLGIVFSDLGSLTVGGQIETVGFGNIEDNISDRNQEDFYEYNITAAVQLGKLFPEKAKVNLPFTYTRTHQRTSPKYDPMNTDTELSKTLDNFDHEKEKDSIKAMSQTDKVYQSYTLNNVRVGITSKTPMPYDPANFSFSLGYNESVEKNPEVEYEKIKNYKGTFNYVYSINPKPVEPFKKVKLFKSNNWKLIRDFNFYYVPKNIAFSTSMTRYYEEIQSRNYNSPIVKDTTFQYMSFDKNWQWDRTADIKWDLTRSLKLRFTSATNSEINEIIRSTDDERLVNIPINKEYLRDINYFDWYEQWKDTVWRSIKEFGEPVSYEQKFTASYAIPINKLPHLDWITSNAQYNANYQWDKGTILSLGESPITGNMMENVRNWTGDVRLNFENFYNKFPYLKDLNRRLNNKNAVKKKDAEPKKPKNYERKRLRLKKGNKTRINHRLNSTNLNVELTDTAGNVVPVKVKTVDANSITITSKEDLNNLTLKITTIVKKEGPMTAVKDYSIRFLTMIRNISVNYRHSDALEVNGYRPLSGFLGQDHSNPGYDFTFGFFNAEKFLQRAYREDSLLIVNENITNPLIHSITQNLTVKSLVEPIPGLKIDLNASWYKNHQTDIYYMYGYDSDWNSQDIAGSFSRTCLPIRTAFKDNTHNSEVFDEFLKNRDIIQSRIYNEVGRENPNGKINYVNKSSADVLIPAFYSTYFGRSAHNVDLNYIPSGTFKSIITSLIPNWKITCDAFMWIPAIKKHFKAFNINHTYKSTYNIGPYESLTDWSNNVYGSDIYGTAGEFEEFNNISSRYDVLGVSINEQFSPLIGLDASMKNSLSMKFEIKKSRTAQLDIPGNQILESSSLEFVVGSGYRFDDIGMILNIGEKQKKFKNDLNLRADIGFKNTDAYIRVIDEEYSQLSSGLRSFTLKFSADYLFSERLNIKLYYDCKSSNPKVSEGFPTITNDFGIAFKINLTR